LQRLERKSWEILALAPGFSQKMIFVHFSMQMPEMDGYELAELIRQRALQLCQSSLSAPFIR
jgi:CheY-like chemotaxis protein